MLGWVLWGWIMVVVSRGIGGWSWGLVGIGLAHERVDLEIVGTREVGGPVPGDVAALDVVGLIDHLGHCCLGQSDRIREGDGGCRRSDGGGLEFEDIVPGVDGGELGSRAGRGLGWRRQHGRGRAIECHDYKLQSNLSYR